MSLYLVRHAKAGSRREWDGPDHVRPLSRKGRRQADKLVDLLADRPITTVLSSPFVRCVETVRPLADKLGLAVEHSDSLAEGSAVSDALDLMRALMPTTAVLCSHGDMIPAILDTLVVDDGLPLPRDYPFAKGSAWELVVDDGRWAGAHYLAPPA